MHGKLLAISKTDQNTSAQSIDSPSIVDKVPTDSIFWSRPSDPSGLIPIVSPSLPSPLVDS